MSQEAQSWEQALPHPQTKHDTYFSKQILPHSLSTEDSMARLFHLLQLFQRGRERIPSANTPDNKKGWHEMNHIKNIRNSFEESTRTGRGKDSTSTPSFWQKRWKGPACPLEYYWHHLSCCMYSSVTSSWGSCFSICTTIFVSNRWERTLSDLSVLAEHVSLGLHQKVKSKGGLCVE